MIKFKVRTETRELQQLQQKLRNPRPALEQIGEMLVRSTNTRLKQTKVSPDGKPWAPWSLATLLGRIRKGTASRGILFDSGALARSVSHKVQGRTVTISADVPYASFLQHGTRNMPARPFLGVSKQNEEFALSILRRHLGVK